ncbi:MAG TPA: hypothetical protein VGB55_15720 [Tepidisphaeraceae bacterium]|jgi:hypothetical protein
MKRAVITLAVLATFSGLATAQEKRREKPAQPVLLKNYVAERIARLERETAELIRTRADATADSAYRELRIDLRILQRWLTQELLTPAPYSDAQAVVWLRHKDLAEVTSIVDKRFATGAAPPTKAQTDALGIVRKATFDLRPIETTAALDAALAPLGSALLGVLGEPGKLVVMRPAVQAAQGGASGGEAASADQLAGRVTQLSVSPALRQQLIAAAAAARTSTGEEAQAQTQMLRAAVELASAMQSNVGVDPAARAEMEAQIGEAIALYSEPRLREAGQQRLDAMSGYRKLAGDVASLSLVPETLRAVQPVINYARANPQESGKVMKALNQFAELEKEAAAFRPSGAGDAISRQGDAQAKLFFNHRATFLETCGRLQGGGAFAAGPEELAEPIEAMKQTAERVQILRRLQKSQTALLELKPRPTGGLEKRINQSLARYADPDPAVQKSAHDFIRDLDRLAAGWSSARASLAKPVAPETVQKYTGQAWPAIETQLRALAADSATAAASGGELEQAKLATLTAAAAMLEQLRTLADFESKLALSPALSRWADCDMNQEKLDKLLDSFRGEFNQTAQATLQGTPTGGAIARYRGLLTALQQLGAYADACAKLPEGTVGSVSRLATPSDDAPFATERYLSFMTDVLEIHRISAEADMDTMGKVEKQMLERLNRDMK